MSRIGILQAAATKVNGCVHSLYLQYEADWSTQELRFQVDIVVANGSLPRVYVSFCEFGDLGYEMDPFVFVLEYEPRLCHFYNTFSLT